MFKSILRNPFFLSDKFPCSDELRIHTSATIKASKSLINNEKNMQHNITAREEELDTNRIITGLT